MLTSKINFLFAGLMLVCISQSGYAGTVPDNLGAEPALPKQAPMPRARQTLPPSPEQSKYNLPPTKKPRVDLMDPKSRQAKENRAKAMTTTPDCKDMNKLASYDGSALADYIVNLPDYECHYGLFSLNAEQAAKVYSAGNFNAVAKRFVQEGNNYNAGNMALVNLLIYLRAGYYLASNNVIPGPSASLTDILRPAIKQLVDGDMLFKANAVGPSTAGETFNLITNMHDEAYYLGSMKALVQRYTNTDSNPNAVNALRQPSAAGGFTGVLTVLFSAHGRSEGKLLLQNDTSYPAALNNFVVSNKAALLGTETAYQLTDTANEAFRFMQYPTQKAGVKIMIKNQLATTTMTGADSDLWLAAATAVKYNDNANCAEYGTCDFETRLADAVLQNKYTCSPTIRIRAQQMTPAQMQSSCNLLQTEESYFHDMLQTNRTPVANDYNTSLEVVVFDDYTNYNRYAGVIFGISTNNGGMYLEGSPAVPGNQARFIAHEASWLRPVFQVWNLEHEYVHYLDGRFDMYGDFSAATVKPTVWWIEGLAEYLSKKNDNQESIDVARTGTYRLSQIFDNTYSMADYVPRAYRWGYMATRFMVERHRNDVDTVVAKFRVGDYDGYQNTMAYIGARYDDEFVSWVKTASTAGEPPLPDGPVLPSCTSSSYLGKNCSIKGLSSSDHIYAYIQLPSGAKNLNLRTTGGSGDVDMYIALDRYPTTSSYDAASTNAGNRENIALATPAAGHWYYILLTAKQAFDGVSLSATYD
ncbi:microbial collagenase [Collimonas sp. PA-H2]|uniref:M9 family metallopeptidase n=1 Tax=Collimonas sp. PA-H2 TaxID=1881062 RepID=UPI000BFA6400|nr:M9 family metallopeptidase [Collimonas sp. PA-H2]PFH11949.1 microbial collagenase [Collimonas sp. PA-H2]